MIDHLVYASPTLDQGIEVIQNLLGVEATPGGQHPQWGTHNALVALGPATYLEIIAPDPNLQKKASIFQLTGLQAPKLVGWAAKADLSTTYLKQLAEEGLEFGTLIKGSRQKPDGQTLSWQLTDPAIETERGLFPFLIDWGNSQHPARTAVQGGQLIELSATHPNPALLLQKLHLIQLNLPVIKSESYQLRARIQTKSGKTKTIY